MAIVPAIMEKAMAQGLVRYFRFYNTERRHAALGRLGPDAVYFAGMNLPQAAL